MIALPFRCAVVNPADADAVRTLRSLAPALGIELTVPALAALCELGNVDDQHSPDSTGTAAILLALSMPLPPLGAGLVTVRPDLDAFGAMAVLCQRVTGSPVGDAFRQRCERIAAADGPRGRHAATAGSNLPPAALAAAVADHRRDVAQRVSTMWDWLRNAAVPTDADVATPDPAEAEIEIVDGRLAVVRSEQRGALGLGYRHAPVVIAENLAFRLHGGAPHRKVTIAQGEEGYVAMPALRGTLSDMEPGWGGTATVLGSPIGRATCIPLPDIVTVVRQHLLDGPSCAQTDGSGVGRVTPRPVPRSTATPR